MSIARTTVYLDPAIYRATKVKAAVTGKAFSTLVSEALVRSLREDEADLAAVRTRRNEPTRPFEAVLRDLKRDGLL